MDTITVICVTYNAEATLESTILSVTGQTYQHTELIIIDGKSLDGTVDIIRKYQDRIAWWVSESDHGIYDAMNKGLVKATGDRIIFLGADDRFISPEILATVFSFGNYNDVDMLYGNVQLSTSKKIFGSEKDYKKLLEQNISHQAIFYKKDLFEKKGKFNTRYKVLADYYYNLELFRDSAVIKKYLPVTITLFNDKGISNCSIDKNFFNDMISQLVNTEKIPAATPAIQQYFFYQGFCECKEGKYKAGLKKIVQSIFYSKRKVFYFLIAVKFLLSFMGIGRKLNFK